MIIKINHSSNKAILLSPHAGGFYGEYRYILDRFSEYSVFAVEYPKSPSVTFDNFAADIARSIVKMGFISWRFIGISMGGYLSFLVSVILHRNRVKIANQLDFISVGNPCKLKQKSSSSDFCKNFADYVISTEENSVFSEVKEFYKEKIFRDIMFFSSTKSFECEKLPIPLNIYYGTNDQVIDLEESKAYWKARTLASINLSYFQSKHIPQTKREKDNLQKVLFK